MPTNATEPDNLTALTDRELDAVAAEKVMGWYRNDIDGYWHDEATGERKELCEDDLEYYYQDYRWSPSTDYNHAAELRRECERRGLTNIFVSKLFETIKGFSHYSQRWLDDEELFAIANATPRDITIAAIWACLEKDS